MIFLKLQNECTQICYFILIYFIYFINLDMQWHKYMREKENGLKRKVKVGMI